MVCSTIKRSLVSGFVDTVETAGDVFCFLPLNKVSIAMRPGITGMWQVSGRSNITDFEEVVRLDTQYIDEWSLALDAKILAKTVLAVVRREGSM